MKGIVSIGGSVCVYVGKETCIHTNDVNANHRQVQGRTAEQRRKRHTRYKVQKGAKPFWYPYKVIVFDSHLFLLFVPLSYIHQIE